MLPHSLHLLQLLDVGCFAAVKRIYRQQVENLIRTGLNHINKPDFLRAYSTTRLEALNTSNIRNSFMATRLVLYNPSYVLEKLHVTLQTPTLPINHLQSSP